MRFRHLRVHAFGRLKDVDTGSDPLESLVVIHGPNESGKSTFFSFLTTLLYGFYPASRDTNPHTPWGGGEAWGEAELETAEGILELERRLRSTPSGTVTRDDRAQDLRNHTLPVADHVPLAVFRQVFALTLSELAALEGESWARVQDRIITGMGTSDLMSPREVAAELERQAGTLWRPNHRGNQVIRSLRARERELARRRRDASENDRKLREIHAQLAETRQFLDDARVEREQCTLTIERYRALLPIRDQMERIRGLEEEAGAPEELDRLPHDPAKRLEELHRSADGVGERLEELDADVAGVRGRASEYDNDARALVSKSDAIRTLSAQVAALEPVRVRVGQVEQEIRDLERRVSGIVDGIFDSPLGPDATELVRALSVEEIERAVNAFHLAHTGTNAGQAPAWVYPRWVAVAALVVGGALLVTGLLMNSALLAAAGGVIVTTGMVGIALPRPGAAAEPDTGSPEVKMSDAGTLSNAFGALSPRASVIERPPVDLGSRVARIQELLRDIADRSRQLTELLSRIASLDEDIEEMRRGVAYELPTDAVAAAYALEERLRDAERRRDVASGATEEIERLERARNRANSELETISSERDELIGAIEALGGGDAEAGLARAASRLRAKARATELKAELERGHHDLAEIQRRIAEAEASGEEWIADDDALARSRARLDQLNSDVEARTAKVERLETEGTYLAKEATVDVIEGELATVRAQIQSAIHDRDRLWALAAVIREADRRFRDEHQPDVLRKAGEKLSLITEGRYDRLVVQEDDPDAPFLLRGAGTTGTVPLGESLSTGTREQAYLALRLAVLDHLDRDGERLPLFMDEAFVNWDRGRRTRAFTLLTRLAEERQIFVFTCHEEMAAELQELGAQRIDLPPLE